MPPLVTIGIPTFNRARLLSQAIESALLQTHTDLEIVVSDDASTDETRETVERFGDPRVRHERNERNVGIPRNWNRCVRLARGEYFALLPDDDVYLPDFVATMVAELEAHPDAGFAQCAFHGVDAELRSIGIARPDIGPVRLRGPEAVAWQLTRLACNPVALMFRRAAMLDMRLWREDYWDDWAFIVRVAYRHGFVYTPRVLAGNRAHGANVSAALARGGRDGVLDWINQLADIFGEALPATAELVALRARLDRQLSRTCVFGALRAVLRRDWAVARRELVRAHRLYPLAVLDPRIARHFVHGLALKAERRRERAASPHREPIIHLKSAAT